MGKATGFLEFDRDSSPYRDPVDRVIDFKEICDTFEQQVPCMYKVDAVVQFKHMYFIAKNRKYISGIASNVSALEFKQRVKYSVCKGKKKQGDACQINSFMSIDASMPLKHGKEYCSYHAER